MHQPLLIAAVTTTLSVFLSSCATHPSALHSPPQIRVDSGDFDRLNSVVTFQMPANLPAFASVESENGRFLPLQVDPSGRASFIVEHLPPHAQQKFHLVAVTDTARKGIEVRRDGSRLHISRDQRTLFDYQAEPGNLPRPNIKLIYLRGGFIHPIFTPSGRLISDSYATNHLHQHGIWFAWTKTEFEGRHPDFWNMGDNKGTVEFVSVDKTWSGPVHGGFEARHRYLDVSGNTKKTALEEKWRVDAYAIGSESSPSTGNLFDLTCEQHCASASPLTLPLYHYGGLGFRGHEQWNNPKSIRFLTSDGETDREKINAARARWCYVGGMVDGQQAGLVILCHPDNFRAPQPMRLHPKEPFFCYAPSQGGDWQIKPGETYLSRYRFVAFDGVPDKQVIERWWNDYAHPPDARVELK